MKSLFLILTLLLSSSVFAKYENIDDVIKQLGGKEYAFQNSIVFFQANFTITYLKEGKIEKFSKADYQNFNLYFFRKGSKTVFSFDKRGKELFELISIKSNHEYHPYKLLDTETKDVIHSFDLGFGAKFSKYLPNSRALFTQGQLGFEVDYKNNKIVNVIFLYQSDDAYFAELLYLWSFKDKYNLSSYNSSKSFDHKGERLFLLHRILDNKTEFIIFSRNESRITSRAETNSTDIGYGEIKDIFVYNDNLYFAGFSSDGGITPHIFQLNDQSIINFGGKYGGQIIDVGNGKAFICIDRSAKTLDLNTNKLIDISSKINCPYKFDIYLQGPSLNTILHYDPEVA